MNTATEISRLTDARNTIRDKLIALGLATSTAKLDALATAVDGIANRGAVSAQVQEGDTYTIPAGYHNGSGTVSGVAGGGNYSLQSKTATPTKSQQSITPDSGYYGLSDVTVAPIPDAYQNVSAVNAAAGDVLAGKIIVDSTGASVTGTMPNNGAVSRTLDATTGNQSYTVPAGYHNGSGAVNIVLETKSATPTTSSQDVTPTSGKVLSKVTVGAIPSNYGNTTGDDAVAANILYGKKAHSNNNGSAVAITGSMPNKGAMSIYIEASSGEDDPLYNVIDYSAEIPVGYHNGSGIVHAQLDSYANVTPSESAQTISPSSGHLGIARVEVAAIPAKYGDTTGDTGVAANVLAGIKVHSIQNGSAVAITGTMTNNGAISGSIDGLTTTSYSVPAGYTTGGTVSLTNDIETALAAI